MCLARSAASHAEAGDTAVGAPAASSRPFVSAPTQHVSRSAAARVDDPPSFAEAVVRRGGAWLAPLAGAGMATSAARGVLALDGSLLPAGVISVPTSRNDKLLAAEPYACTESTLLVSVSPSSRAAVASVAGTTAPSASLHECRPLCDADGSSVRSSAQELRRRSSSSPPVFRDDESHRCASSHLDGRGLAFA
ncbi:hypothetical protein ACP70R_026702 [Stipagrostis hirtigluma subsp. patula]